MVSAPWALGGVKLQRRVLTAIERAAREAYARDEEACGYLSGPASDPLRVDEVVVLENLANKYHAVDPDGHPRTGREYFKINALRFNRALETGKEAGHPIKVFFHSHLDCGAYFSEEDARSMTMGDGSGPTYPELCYLVTAVDLGQVTNHRLFRWDAAGATFVEAPFEAVDD